MYPFGYQERWYNGHTIHARRLSFSNGSNVPLDDLVKELKALGKGLKKPTISVDVDEDPYGGFNTYIIEVSGKPK